MKPDRRSQHVPGPQLSIIIPAYNEARRIGRTLEAVREFVNRAAPSCELIVVDDGSRDGTAEVVRRFESGAPPVRLLGGAPNRGKGHAVRQGMLAARGDALLMCDADLSTPIEEIGKLLPWLARGFDVVIASRDLPDSHLDPPQPLSRRLLAWTFRAIRRRLLLPDIRDTQCGFKLFRRAAAREVFSRQMLDGWLFDCEALGLAERLGYRIKEVGVRWRNDRDSRVSAVREALSAIPTLLAIRRRMKSVARRVDRESGRRDPEPTLRPARRRFPRA